MLLFFIFYLVIYGGLNAYLYFTVRSGIGGSAWWVAGLLALLVLAPLIVRAVEGRVRGRWVSWLAWLGFNWMGVAFIFGSLALLADLLQLLLPAWPDAESLLWVLGLTGAVAVYGMFEARSVRVNHVTVRAPKLKLAEGESLRMVQISDLHLGFGTSFQQVTNIVEKIRSLIPDLLVSTGDLYDSDLGSLHRYVRLFESLELRLGKYAVTGNHEVYAGLDEAMAMTKESGFRVLQASADALPGGLYLAGVDDPEVLGERSSAEYEQEALEGIPEDAFVVLLKHRPEISKGPARGFELQLSGHTHGGQIFPFIYLTRLQYRVRHGLSKVGEDRYLYLSRGTGSWGPKIRVGAPPAITVFDFVHGESYEIEEKSEASGRK